MSAPLDYVAYERTIAQLRGAEDLYDRTRAKPDCDKYSAGFNKDPRFRAFEVNVGFDSDHGYYGNSGCSTLITFHSKDLVEKAFVAYLNRHWRSIFAEMADDLQHASEKSKADRIEELKAELARLEGVMEVTA